jgi:O-antigen ligase
LLVTQGIARFAFLTRSKVPRTGRSYFGPILTGIIALVLLQTMAQILIRSRSIKYPVALILVGVIASIFLAMRGRHSVLLCALGFSLPLYVEVILLERSVNLAITGTFLTAIVMLVAGFWNGGIPRDSFLLVPQVSLPVLLFIAAGFLTLVNSSDMTGTMISISQEVEMLIVFLALVNSIRDESDLRAFLGGLYFSLALECILYVIQNFLGFSFDIVGNRRMVGASDLEEGLLRSQRGTLGAGPIITGMYFGVMALTLIGAHLCRKKLRFGLHPFLGMMISMACLILTAKRSPWGGFALGILTILFLVVMFARGALPRLGRVLTILAVPVLVLLPIILVRAQADHESDYEERVNLTRIAWRMHDAHPWVGVGFGTYNDVKRLYLPENWVGWVYTVHNRYLMIMAETGIIGVSCLLIVYLLILRQAWHGIRATDSDHRPFQIGLFAALIAIYWQMLWEICDSRQAYYIYWFIAALAIVVPRIFAEKAPARDALQPPSAAAEAKVG